MAEKVYADGTTLYEMIEDGWSRGFDPKQTVEEAAASGIIVDIQSVVGFYSMHAEVYDLKQELIRMGHVFE